MLIEKYYKRLEGSDLDEEPIKNSGANEKKGGGLSGNTPANREEPPCYYVQTPNNMVQINKVSYFETSQIQEDSYFVTCAHGVYDVPQTGLVWSKCILSHMESSRCTEAPTGTIDGLCANCMHENLVIEHDDYRRLQEMERKLRGVVIM